MQITEAQQLGQWLSRLPLGRDPLAGASLQGQAQVELAWQGGWNKLQQRLLNPAAAQQASGLRLQGQVQARALRYTPEHGTASLLQQLQLSLSGTPENLQLQTEAQLQSGTQTLSLDTALTAGLWNAGSLNGLTWAKTWPSAPLIIIMLVCAALLVRRMRLLEMGDDSACALGVSVERSRLMMMLVAVVLTAAATALAGPISFIALVAPHIARRISGTSRWGLTLSALCGALLLLMADLCAQQLFMPYQLPVGVVTVSLGGIYLIVLLIQESRKK